MSQEKEPTAFDKVMVVLVMLSILTAIYSVFVFIWEDEPTRFNIKLFITSAFVFIVSIVTIKVNDEINNPKEP